MARPRSPLSPPEILDLYFLDARHKLIEIAAFLDRLDRSRAQAPAGGSSDADDDYRLRAFRAALGRAAEPGPDRAGDIQIIFSDPTREPVASARGLKGATGAWKGPAAT